MRFENCDFRLFKNKIQNRKVILFGVGQAFRAWIGNLLVDSGIDKQIEYAVDNVTYGSNIRIGDCSFSIHHPDKLKVEKNIVILITNLNYMLDIYQQLERMMLDDTVSVFVMHYIMAVSCGEKVPALEKMMCNEGKPQIIEKTINTFWFSGDPIPDSYRRCMDSWSKYCPDYEIKIWDRNNYDCEKNAFMRKALSCKKWAFVSDYARVDVLYNNGGIYMDMDVEVVKNMDSLLGNTAFFSFNMYNDVGLEVFGTTKENLLLKRIMEKYDSSEFDISRMMELAQPCFIRNIVKEFGVCLDGNMQCVEDMIFAPRSYFNPQDPVVYEYFGLDKDTFTIHRSNAAWKEQKTKNEALEKAKVLWEMIK